MTRIQEEVKAIAHKERENLIMLESAFGGVGYGIN